MNIVCGATKHYRLFNNKKGGSHEPPFLFNNIAVKRFINTYLPKHRMDGGDRKVWLLLLYLSQKLFQLKLVHAAF